VTGVVYLVGAGPGAPDLITLRAAKLLARADVVFFDALVHPEVVALAERAECIAVGKRCGAHSSAQRFINKRLVDAALRHAVVVRLKGGDPGLFGRAEEELSALREAGIACEIVPGISAAFAASAALGVSLTRRGVARNVVFATPRVGESQRASDWAAPILSADTAALYMAGEQVAEIAASLMARGKPANTPAVLVESASLSGQRERAFTLAELATRPPEPSSGPTILLLGNVYAQLVQTRVERSEARATAS
jgi:uroporphyrin-III C-methyltransferase